MKSVLLITFIIIINVSLYAEENLFELLDCGRYNETIRRINEKEDIEIYPEFMLNGVLMISYLGIEDYQSALLYSDKITDVWDTHSMRPYQTIIKFRNGIITLDEAIADFDSLVSKTDYNYNISGEIILFYIENHHYEKAEEYIAVVSARKKMDSIIYSLNCFLILSRGHISEFINNYIEISSKDIKQFDALATPFIQRGIEQRLNDVNEKLILALFHYINQDFEKSESEFKSFLSEKDIKSESEFVETYCNDFSEEVTNIAKKLYVKLK